MKHAVWNTLHDGSIESIGGAIPGDVHVRVEIAYLCGKLPTVAGHVVIHLRGCRKFEYRPVQGAALTDLSEIAAAEPEILTADEVDGLVSVACVGGLLQLIYDRADVSLAEGRAVSQTDLEAAAERYWTEWEENAKHARSMH